MYICNLNAGYLQIFMENLLKCSLLGLLMSIVLWLSLQIVFVHLVSFIPFVLLAELFKYLFFLSKDPCTLSSTIFSILLKVALLIFIIYTTKKIIRNRDFLRWKFIFFLFIGFTFDNAFFAI